MYKFFLLSFVLSFLFSCVTVNEENNARFDSRCPIMSNEERIAHEKLPYYRPPPYYPGEAVRKGIEGYVDFEFDISVQGHPINIGVIEVYPSDIFVKAGLQSVKGHKYDIRIVNGEPAVSHCHSIRIVFELEK